MLLRQGRANRHSLGLQVCRVVDAPAFIQTARHAELGLCKRNSNENASYSGLRVRNHEHAEWIKAGARQHMYPEPWHLSYAPLSTQAIKLVTPDLLRRVTMDANILGKELVLERIDEIFEKHVLNICLAD